MGEDVGHYGGSYKVTKDLYKKYGDSAVARHTDRREQLTGMAIGAAMTGCDRSLKG
jgi:pyruvate dehydrogenase E1 component beta subunit